MKKRKINTDWDFLSNGFVRSVIVNRDRIADPDSYPYTIPAVAALNGLKFHPKVTYFVGENGSGKSTILEAIAVRAGFNAEGGGKNFNFSTSATHSDLEEAITLIRGAERETDGWFLRAESFYNVATHLDDIGIGMRGYGGKSLHQQSHGESFIALTANRFVGHGLYILDEPEAALSPARQLALLQLIDMHVTQMHSQFIIATHSPIVLAYPNSTIYHLSGDGIAPIQYEDTEHYKVTLDFLTRRESYLHHLFNP